MTENCSQESTVRISAFEDWQNLTTSRPIFRYFSTVFWYSIGDVLRVICENLAKVGNDVSESLTLQSFSIGLADVSRTHFASHYKSFCIHFLNKTC